MPQVLSKKKILLVDDDVQLSSSLADYLREKGCKIDKVATGLEAIEQAKAEKIDVILLDMILPDMHGIDALKELKRISPSTKIIMITGFASVETAVAAVKKGADDYLAKPFEMEELHLAIRKTLEESQFDKRDADADLDFMLGCLSNPIRRNILRMLYNNRTMAFMEITKMLGITDHTKVSFHLRKLKETGLITKTSDRFYVLTNEGNSTFHSLSILNNRQN